MRWFVVIAYLVSLSCTAICQTPIDIQPVKELEKGNGLASCRYAPVDQEKSYFDKLALNEQKTGSFMKAYSIHAKSDKYVSWYGIVRGVVLDKGGKGYTLLLEHKYFDGLTDCHIMLVSQSGSGDFTASLQGNVEAIPPLALVRVYGKVGAEKDGIPQIAAEYIRVWPWLTFTFSDLGAEDHSNPRWAQYCKLCKNDRIYNPYPTRDYYLQMLGEPRLFGLNLDRK